jgi:hypothetical protein
VFPLEKLGSEQHQSLKQCPKTQNPEWKERRDNLQNNMGEKGRCEYLLSPLIVRYSTQLGTPRGRYDEHSSKFPSVVKPRFIQPVGESETSEGDAR